MPTNPYTDNSDSRADVNDADDLISANSHNNVRETTRYLKQGIQHVTAQSAVYGLGSYDLVRSGHDLDNCYVKSAFPQLFVSSLDATPSATFQEHCLTNRGECKHIIVDSSVSLGQCNNLINSNTLIEGAVFDNVSGTYKELDVGGISDLAVTVGALAGSVYPISNVTAGSRITKKINIGDKVWVDDGVTSAWGEVAGNIVAGGCDVTFYSVPPIGANIDCVIFKTNITFHRCTFLSQVQVLNTFNCIFEDCIFIHDHAGSKAGAILANIPYFGNAGGGAGTYGITHGLKVVDCVFRFETNPTTNTFNPSGLRCCIEVDKAAFAIIEGNRFHGFKTMNAVWLPVESHNTYQKLSGGVITDNTLLNWAATVANTDAGAAKVAALYANRNITDVGAGIW